MENDHWWLLKCVVRFYGYVVLAGTKLADAVTTAIGSGSSPEPSN